MTRRRGCIPERPVTPETHRIYKASRMMGEDRDCSVRALTVLTGMPYQTVRSAFAAAGRLERDGVHDFMAEDAAAKLGFKLIALGPEHRRRGSLDPPPKWVRQIMDRYPASTQGRIKGLTTYHPHLYPEAWADLPPLLLCCAGHHAAFKDGKVHDFASNRAMHIVQAYRLEPRD